MSNGEYKSWLDSTAGSIHDHDDSEHKCWECGGKFPTSKIVNGKKFWKGVEFVDLCEPCFDELERIEAEAEAEEENQINTAIHNDVIKTMRK